MGFLLFWGGGALPPLPADALIIVPVRNTVLFPGLVLPHSVREIDRLVKGFGKSSAY